ncbi:MAG: stage V sporulation protein S [Clostridia bacterium]|nr:stage V sporulation protein S [Clostridia bacterium]
MEILTVSSRSNPKSVAGRMCAAIRKDGCCQVKTIGAGALSQGVKSVAVARNYLDMDLIFRPTFEVVNIDGKDKTVISMDVDVYRGV